MNTLEKRIESLEKSAKRWKLATLAAVVVMVCCGATENAKVVTFDEVRAKKFICVKDDGTHDYTAMGNGVLMARQLHLTKSNVSDPYCVIHCTKGDGIFFMDRGDENHTYIEAGLLELTREGKTKIMLGTN